MDGTLSPARQPIIDGMLEALIELSSLSDIGIVTGSGITYIKQQCASIIDNIDKFNSELTLFPCNGTQVYKINSPSSINCIFSENMKAQLGEDFNELLLFTLQEQARFVKMVATSNVASILDLSGTFIQYRDSMLNWCPTGRDATPDDRATFITFDKKHKIRERLIEALEIQRMARQWQLDFTIGGSTSIDIYPSGWDKTFVLRHVNVSKGAYFIGDRCREGGNDKTLYEKINKEFGDTAYETTSPENTLQLMDEITQRIQEKRTRN